MSRRSLGRLKRGLHGIYRDRPRPRYRVWRWKPVTQEWVKVDEYFERLDADMAIVTVKHLRYGCCTAIERLEEGGASCKGTADAAAS